MLGKGAFCFFIKNRQPNTTNAAGECLGAPAANNNNQQRILVLLVYTLQQQKAKGELRAFSIERRWLGGSFPSGSAIALPPSRMSFSVSLYSLRELTVLHIVLNTLHLFCFIFENKLIRRTAESLILSKFAGGTTPSLTREGTEFGFRFLLL